MKDIQQANSGRGLVVSDLHLFARRSEGMARFDAMRAELEAVEWLVLNGDTFDFRWSTLRGQEATVAAALAWLRELADELPRCEIHFVFGNHDCLAGFDEALAGLAAVLPWLRPHADALQLGSSLFLHGDCAHSEMDARRFNRYRAAWRRDRQRGPWGASAYAWADRLGLTRLAHQWHFPRRETVRRIAFYLDQTRPRWRRETRHCYFGHTHLPFTSYAHEGITFHNTGSAIRGMAFNPLCFAP